MSCKRVAQCVRRNSFVDTGGQRVAADQFPKSLAAERLTGAIGKDIGTRLSFEQTRAGESHEGIQLFPSVIAEWHRANFRALPSDNDVVALKVDFLGLQSHQLGHAQ